MTTHQAPRWNKLHFNPQSHKSSIQRFAEERKKTHCLHCIIFTSQSRVFYLRHFNSNTLRVKSVCLVDKWLLSMPAPHLFNGAVGERMCSHVKQQEVLLLCSKDPFLHQVFCQTLSDISQLVVQLQGIPGLSWGVRKENNEQILTCRQWFTNNKS